MRTDNWEQVRKWRVAKRTTLRSLRLAVPQNEKHRVNSTVQKLIRQNVPELQQSIIGFYWPFKGEIDLRHLVQNLVGGDGKLSLPVVVEKHRPLEFWSWRPGMRLRRGVWDIPVPLERDVVHPTALLVPMLGFDEAGYRLGYGGGYYDRTLAAMTPRPLTVGVGYELGRLPTIYPQSHDVSMDAIATEAGVTWFRRHGKDRDASHKLHAAIDK